MITGRTTPTQGTVLTWDIALSNWRTEQAAAGIAAGTIRLWTYYLRRWARTCKRPERATRKEILSFLARPTWKPNTRKSARSALVCFYGWMWAEQLLPPTPDGRAGENPAGRLPAVHAPLGQPRPASDEAISAALVSATARVWLMIMLGAVGGLRRAEIARVHRDDLDGLRLRVLGKGGKTRVIDLPEVIASKIRECDGWVFPNADIRHPTLIGQPLSADYVGKLISAVLPKGVTPHQLRHAAASQLWALGVPIEEIQVFLGHAMISTTMIYTKIWPRYTAAAT
ncbi:MAG TPA: site-specific integrase, partial [Propionibacteriaceae bacterium]|nr:site-specific integrase [Propionibacteriaceae bacterium]